MNQSQHSSAEADMLADANMFPTLLAALRQNVAALAKYENRKGFQGAEALKSGREAIDAAEALNRR